MAMREDCVNSHGKSAILNPKNWRLSGKKQLLLLFTLVVRQFISQVSS